MEAAHDLLARLDAGAFVDLVVVITLVEAVLLWAWSRRGGPIDFDALRPSLASGLMLMLALRAAVAGSAWPWVVLPVTMAGICHVWDLRRRWHRSRPAEPVERPVPARPLPHAAP